MTGQYPRAIGIVKNAKDFRPEHPDIVTLPQFFRNQGYYAARVSKIYHMGIPRDIIAGTSGVDDAESWDEAINVKGPEQYAVGQKEDLSPKVTHKGVDFVKIEAEGDDLVHADGMAAAEAIGLLQKLKDRKFFLALGMVRPHVPLAAPKSYFEPYPPQDMELADVPEGDLDDVPRAAQSQTNAVKYGMNDEQQRKTLSAYYACVSYMDAQVGKVLDELERLGLDDNTVVVFTSDHGYNLGQHTSWQKLSLWEDSVRSPLIISAPGAKAKRCDRVVELLDIYPTLVDLCGFDVPAGLAGKSLGPLVADPDTKAWEDKAAYTISTGAGESLRTQRWRYNLWGGGKKGVELYDHDNDPGEFTNLADDEEYRGVVERLNVAMDKARERAQSVS
jgi:arylsulfatase A-like enzyme